MCKAHGDDSDALQDGEPLDEAANAFNSIRVTLFAILDAKQGMVEGAKIFRNTLVDAFKFGSR